MKVLSLLILELNGEQRDLEMTRFDPAVVDEQTAPSQPVLVFVSLPVAKPGSGPGPLRGSSCFVACALGLHCTQGNP